MWYASKINRYHHHPWLMSLMYRLLSGESEVVVIYSENLFQFEVTPSNVKTNLYYYRYTPWSQT